MGFDLHVVRVPRHTQDAILRGERLLPGLVYAEPGSGPWVDMAYAQPWPSSAHSPTYQHGSEPLLPTVMCFGEYWDVVHFLLSEERRSGRQDRSEGSWERSLDDPLGWSVIGASASEVTGLPGEINLQSEPLDRLRTCSPEQVKLLVHALKSRPPLAFDAPGWEGVYRSEYHPDLEQSWPSRKGLTRHDFDRMISSVMLGFYEAAVRSGEGTLYTFAGG